MIDRYRLILNRDGPEREMEGERIEIRMRDYLLEEKV
jgi:hypothetical protein